MSGRWIVGACVTLLAACTNVKDSRQNEVTFTCEGGVRITAWFQDGGVRLLLPGDTDKITLTQVRAGTGDSYETGGLRFEVNADTATLERNGKRVYHGCAT
ncbi:MAG TPA: MliC family protein [Longimicrobium sp.]